jgi:outer membrane protein assembly factor BamB
LLACLLLAPAAAGDWASFHGDDRNTGFASGTAYGVPAETWWTVKAEGDAQAKASPILKDHLLLTASAAGLVQALDSRTGKELWRHQMDAGVEGTGAIAGERAYVVDKAGNLKALNLRDGRVEHTASVGATLGSITEHEGKLFVGNEAGELRAYLASTLTLLWTFKLTEIRLTATFATATGWTCTNPVAAMPIRGAPAVFGGKVFFGALNHYVVALAEDGNGDGKTNIRWIHKTDDIVVGAPTIATHQGTTRVVVGSYDGYVRGYLATASGEGNNPCNGAFHTPDWSFQAPDPVGDSTARGAKVHSSPANSGDRVFVGTNTGRVYALNTGDGTKVWETVAGSNLEPVTSSPAIANGIVTVGSEDKRVYWIAASNGTILRTVETPAAVSTSPAIDGSMAFVAATDGTLYAFGPVRPKQADLHPADGKLTTTLLWLNVRNSGEAASAPTKLTYTRDGQPWLSLDIPALQPGAETRLERTVDEQPTTNHYVLAIDPDNLVPEKDEANNIVEFDYTIEVGIPPATTTPASSSSSDDSFDIPAPWAGLAVVALLAAAGMARPRRR